MSRVIHQRCPTCGGPLTVPPDQTSTLCQFCGHSVQLQRTNLGFPARPHAAHLTAGQRLLLILVLALVPLVGSMVGVYFLVFAQRTASGPQLQQAVESLAQRVGSRGSKTAGLPARCDMNQTLEITNTTFEGPGTLIDANINCTVTIKHCKLKGTKIVSAPNLVEITVEDSTLDATDIAIDARMNAKITVTQRSLIKGNRAGISAGVNGKVVLANSQVQGLVGAIEGQINLDLDARSSQIQSNGIALIAGLNPHVVLTDSTLKSPRIAMAAGHNLDLTLQQASLQGGQVALCTAMNSTIVANESTLDGAEALRTQHKPQRLELMNSKVTGKQSFAGGDCD